MTDLKEREIEKLNVIKKVFIGECTKKEASDSLGLTVRQINRLLIKFKEEGEKGDLFTKIEVKKVRIRLV